MNVRHAKFVSRLPAELVERINRDAPTGRAIMAILDGLESVAGLSMRAALTTTPEQPEAHPVLDFFIDEGRLFLLRLNCPGRIFLRFTTRTDLKSFLDAAKPAGAVSGRELAGNRTGWPVYFEMMTAFQARDVDYARVARALPDTLRRSPALRGVHRADDTELETLLRDIHKPQDEMVFDEMIERMLDLITEDNFDAVMEGLWQYDPMAEEDPSSVPGMRLILMNDLVRERGVLLEKSREWLPSVRSAFEAIGEHASAGFAETETLIGYIDDKRAGMSAGRASDP